MYLDEVDKNRNERNDIQFEYSTSCNDDLEKNQLGIGPYQRRCFM